MPFIHVCSLARVEATAESIGAGSLITLLRDGTPVTRPRAIAPDRHLYLSLSDVVGPAQGEILPADKHVRDLIAFARGWDRQAPMLVHCYAGVSRSTAAAFICACALNPSRPEDDIARAIRAASPTATPKALLVEIADQQLAREGRMSSAVQAIGRGEFCEEGVPFSLMLN